MTKPRPSFQYDRGSYDQRHVLPRRRIADERVEWFINQWLMGKQPIWLCRQPLGEEGQRISAKALWAHARRLELQAIIPVGASLRPGEGNHVERPYCGLRTERRKGRPTNEQKRMAAYGAGESTAPPDPDWFEKMQAKMRRTRAEERAALAGIEPEPEQLQNRQPIDLDALEASATPSRPAHSTTGDHEKRIRPHGADDNSLKRATMLQEEGFDHDHAQGPEQPPSDATEGQPQAPGDPKRPTRRKPAGARRKPRADRAREEEQRHGQGAAPDEASPVETRPADAAAIDSDRDAEPGH